MPGPPKTPTVVRLLRGNPGRRPINRNEPQPTRPEAVPEPPGYLLPYATEEWRRLAPELWHMGVLTVLDLTVFAAYCQAYARWRLAEEALARMTARDSVTHGLLVKTIEGNVRRNPLTKVAADAARDMVTYAGQFGMGAAARARISAGIRFEPPSKFGDLLA
jgi:P27 family predicted phage terminase small subunit